MKESRKMRHGRSRSFFNSGWVKMVVVGLVSIFGFSALLYVLSIVNHANITKEMRTGETELIHSINKKYFATDLSVQRLDVATTKLPKRWTLIDSHLSYLTRKSIEKKVEETYGKWTNTSSDLIVSYTYLDSTKDSRTNLHATVENYQWNIRKKRYEVIQHKELMMERINSENEHLITANALLHNESNLALLRWASQMSYLREAKDGQSKLDDILNLPTFTSETKIETADDYVLVHLPDVGTIKNQSIKVPYELFASAITFNSSESIPNSQASESAAPIPGTAKKIALTFDDGPNPNTTPQILDTLKEKNTRATFFQLGKNAATYPELVKRVFKEGHDLGSHTFSHKQLTKLDPSAIQKELTDTDKAIFQATGTIPYLIRPPYGATNATVAKLASRPLIMWNIDSEDWKFKNAAKSLEQIKQTIKPNGIILMHDIQPSTAEMLPELIDWLRAQGYEMVTINELFQSKERPLTSYFSEADQRAAN